MKKFKWVSLVGLNIVVVLCILLPFFPGPYDKLAYGLSMLAQLTGFLGLLLIPIGVLWLIQEIRKIKTPDSSYNNWNNGYYFGITAMVIGIVYCLFAFLILFFSVGLSATTIAIAIVAILLRRYILKLKKLKYSPGTAFNTTPLYLLSIPIIAFAVRIFLVGPISDYSRNHAISQGMGVINAIENYHIQRNQYPASIDELYDVPKPFIIGINEFEYEKNGDGYNLYFVQWQHLGATREVVMYNKNDEHTVKGHFADFKARSPHWKYFWLD